ncbi:hypothetical protein L596_006499 [Steinernema carpocapsae]|uniref:Uncharacterized protein n=1 Tax=Steinernema carpocapsae TaxID=34508 RepID=A0A4V6YT01_STECR|nr:hypothetical protein L596_006499 [Steinernema carpocapsae]
MKSACDKRVSFLGPFNGCTKAPPSNKNYGVNTLLQTNLVDSKGRVMKGVNVVPIRVPGSAEMKNAKGSRATASQVESEAENVVPIRFGKAGGRL